MYRLVASDMDETFLNQDHKIPQANIDAIAEMRSKGVLFVPASGRAYHSVLQSCAAIPKELLEGSYVISYNGGCINKISDDTPITSHQLPFDLVKAIYDWAMQFDVGFHIYETTGKVWGSHLQQSEIDYLRGHMPYTDFTDDSLSFLKDVPLAKMLVVKPDGMPYLRHMCDIMPKDLKDQVTYTFSSNRYFEFNPLGVDKGTGLKQLLELLHIDPQDSIACGDAQNDMPMMEVAGVGVCVSNADDDVKADADYVAKASCDDGVLKEVVEQFIN